MAKTHLVLSQFRDVGRATDDERRAARDRIENAIRESGQTLADAIARTRLYFRISIAGACNLSCSFCHNEGGPTHGRLDIPSLHVAGAAAVRAGFTRIQLTGGEPLMHPDVGDFVAAAREHVADVGITTNGTFLALRLTQILEGGLTRLHISLQQESLRTEAGAWEVPDWLQGSLERCEDAGVTVRLNLPVAHEDIDTAADFLRRQRQSPAAYNVFTLLSGTDASDGADYSALIEGMVASESRLREEQHLAAVGIRPRRYSTGFRCGTCPALARCTEESRSLRLGVDGVLRPCLATRYWDLALDPDDPIGSVYEAALLSVDFDAQVWA